MNFFAALCFFWAAIGIGSRIGMALMGKRWKDWELGKAYTEKKPAWLYVLIIFGAALIITTWVMVFTQDVKYSWIIAVLITLTSVKLGMFMFKYDEFRAFVSRVLSEGKRIAMINTAVLVLAAGLIGMGLFVY